MSKTGESYATARAHLLAERASSSPRDGGFRQALHLTNGDSTVLGLRDTGLGELIQPWRDVLHEGPVPDVPDDALRRVRSEFLMARGAGDIGTESEFTTRDQLVADHREGNYVLWFEADLYDQLQLIQILSQLHALAVPGDRITLICIGEFPGIAHFGGLGELISEQLARLPEMAGTRLTSHALEHAVRAWAALRAADPSSLGTIATTPSRELRFLSEAFDRLSREYPSTRDGLSLTERRIMAAVGETTTTAGTAFVRTVAREARPFLGDTWCFDRMTRLLNASTPLLETDRPATSVSRQTQLRMTEVGRRVLDGQEDHLAINGVDRWIGGVHLTGHAIPWRWDEGTESIVRIRS
jgi:hypothetical protein